MMQSLDLHRTPARPAAALAKPGTWPSCALEPRELGVTCMAIGKENQAGRAFGFGGVAIHRDSIIGQDRRDQEDQRGRAVACA
ncbi:hypothetical protein [Longimicrobium sp.]|uniref:hypothetical protein n=1 Tax=Longimicrobium sp. TaxID=2029185 RepID=UPI002E3208DA|nr:hypothetical protein [Longimicrobium sp.]HEX6036527.1 hypothetical protein [Longimicrobium sp.]